MTAQATSPQPTATLVAEDNAMMTGAEVLSAWLDGALTDALTDDTLADDTDDTRLPAAVAAYLADDAGRADWDTYHLIGDVLRTPDLAIAPSPAFTTKLARALAAEPAHGETPIQPAPATVNHLTARHPAAARWRWLMRPARPALALAAAVALAVWVLRPLLTDADPTATLMAESTPAPWLHDYLDAHRQQVGPSVARQVVSFTMTDNGAAR